MTNFLDRFGLRRRAAPRIRALWLIDVQVPGKDSFTGFFTRDISAAGLFLEGAKPNAFSEMAKVKGGITIRIRLPVPLGIVPAQAEVKWEREEDGKALSGWAFTSITRDGRKSIEDYVEAHPEDLLKPPEVAPRCGATSVGPASRPGTDRNPQRQGRRVSQARRRNESSEWQIL